MVKAISSIIMGDDDYGGYQIWNEARFRQRCDDVLALGMKWIIVHNVTSRTIDGNFIPNSVTDQQLEGVLSVCDEKGLNVIVGTHYYNYWWVTDHVYWELIESNFQQELTAQATIMDRLNTQFSAHPSFKAWFVVPEIGTLQVTTPKFIDMHGRYWKMTKTHSYGKPIFVTAYASSDYGDNPPFTPDQIQQGWYSLLSNSGVNGGVVWVDEASNYVNYQDWANFQNHFHLGDYWGAFKAACQSLGIQPIIQTECFARIAPGSQTEEIANWDRVKQQLDYELGLSGWINIYSSYYLHITNLQHPVPLYPQLLAYTQATTGLSGTVLDSTTGLPLQGATVTIGDFSTITDATGAYAFTLDPESYIVSATKTGYQTYTASVTVPIQGILQYNFSMVSESQIYGSLHISAFLGTTEVIATFSVTDAAQNPVLSGTTPYTITNLLPGAYAVICQYESKPVQTKNVTVMVNSTAPASFNFAEPIGPGFPIWLIPVVFIGVSAGIGAVYLASRKR